jgi:hypothetical protein
MAISCVYKPKTHSGADPSRRISSNLIDLLDNPKALRRLSSNFSSGFLRVGRYALRVKGLPY